VLEAADSLGLLYLEEPGGYHAIGHDPFSRTIINEKLHRMIYRDRSHPSLVIYNMINEYGGVKARDKALVAKRMNDMREAHKVDPSRMLTFTSGWALKENDDEDSKANMRPFDSTLYRRGWFDNHRAGGPMTYEEGYYRSSKDNYMYTDNRTEIFMRGEEGAISTPPRIQLIYDEIARTGKTGWDGLFWETQYREFKSFFDKKGLAKSFGTLDSLTRELGDIQLEHQGKRLMGMRMQDLGDIYVVNGWESMPYDNHSGIVDNYRNVKGNTEAFSRYTQPLYVAVCPQRQIMKTPSTVNVDYYIVNEYRISGQYGLTVSVTSPDGVCTTVDCNNVKIKGSDIFGQLLAENVKFDINGKAGYYTLRAELKDNKGTVIATGSERVLGVDWNASELKGNGAIYADAESSVPVFFKNATGRQLPAFKPSMKKLDWIIVDRSPLDDPKPVSKSWLKNLKAKWFADNDISALAGTAADEDINHNFIDGAQPHSSLPANQSFSVIWDGEMTVPEDGVYMIGANTDNGVRLTVNGKQILDFWGNRKETTVARPFNLKKGETVTIHFEYRQLPNKGHVSLVCSSPGDVGIAPDVILDKVKNNGTTLLLVGATEKWMDVINNRSDIGYHGFYTVGKNWVGGCHFVAEHPLFAGLPTNCAMNWPYQALVHEGDKRLGLCIDNDNMVVGSYSSMPFNLGSNVGTLAYGKGTIVYSTLDITGNLCKTDGPSEVARKLLCNMISYSMK
jgi:beta-galactosidase